MKDKNNTKEKVSAHIFLFDQKLNSVLLHQRDEYTVFNPNMWAFFGGGCSINEIPEECAVRELEEETGITVNKKDIVLLTNYYNEELETHRYIFFIEKYVSKLDIHLTEGKDCEWVSLDKVFDYDLTENTERDLKMFLRSRK